MAVSPVASQQVISAALLRDADHHRHAGAPVASRAVPSTPRPASSGSSAAPTASACACAATVAVTATAAKRSRRRRGESAGNGVRGGRTAVRAFEFGVDQVAMQAAGEAAAREFLKQYAEFKAMMPDIRGAASAATKAVPPEVQANAKEALFRLAAALPEPPAEVRLAAEQTARNVLASVPPELVKVIEHPELLDPVIEPAGWGLAVVVLLALRRGPQTWGDELPRDYDYGQIEAYWQRRPWKLATRFIEAGLKVGSFILSLYIDEWTGNLAAMRPQRAVQARELITDLGVTFIKIAQVWASRPDVLPEEYIKEYVKLLEQVRPFGKEEALETLRRAKKDGVSAADLFEDLSVFEKPIASASVGQVYKAQLNGQTVAVKVQRPDVKEQSTLDLYVIRNAGFLGSFVPIPRIWQQSRSLIELIDLTAPTFVQELDYEREAANQRKFEKTVQDCDLIADTVEVPEVLYANQEVLVQSWLDGKKLTEPGAAQEQAGRVVKLLLNSYMVQFLETGFLHGDPHPGNFILMDSGKLGILDYGLMTSITSEKRLAFIEFLMHIQAKEYGRCLQDLINLEFFPAALGEDKEAVDIIVPTLASTLATLYEEGGDLKKKSEMFKKQREEMQASGKLDVLRTQLQEISKKYSGSFRLPPYFTLILRAFSTLEGLGLKTNDNFAIVKECFPYIARRLITDDSFRMREALKSYLYKGRTRIAVSRIDDLANGFGTFTNLMKGSRTAASQAGGPIIESAEKQHVEQVEKEKVEVESPDTRNAQAQVNVDNATKDIAQVVFSPNGNFLQDLLIDEGVAAIDALSRAALVRLLRSLGPLALPISLPLGFLLGTNAGNDSRILTREDKEALLVLRRIVQLIQDSGRGADDSPAEAVPQAPSRNDIANAAAALQRLQPLAAGLLPTVTPGATAFARRFAQQLARRLLSRLADDLEKRSGAATTSVGVAA